MNIGEVSATLKANVGQYVAAMLQAGKSTAEIQQIVENTTKALLAEGAAGQAAGKGLASFGASTQQLAQQLADAEKRLAQMTYGLQRMGVSANSKGIRDTADEIQRLRAALAAAGHTPPIPNPVPPTLPPRVKDASAKLTQLRGTLTSLAAAAVGVPGPLGNLASKLLMFGVGGGVTVAVAAGLAIIATAFTKLREKAVAESEATKDAVDGLVQRYREATGAILRENKERAQAAVEEVQREVDELNRSTGPRPVARSLVGGLVGGVGERTEEKLLSASQRLAELTIALRQANREWDEFRESAVAAGADAAEETRRAAESVKGAMTTTEGGMIEATKATQKMTDALRVLKGQADAVATEMDDGLRKALEGVAEEQRLIQELIRAQEEKALQGTKGDSRLKDAVENQRQEAVDAMRGVADAMARGFMDAFSDNQKNLADKIASALLRAAQDAIAQLLASKIFGGLLDALFGGGKGKGGLGGLIEDIPVIGNILSAPSLPAPESVSGGMGATIVVPLDNLPRPLSPLEYARDDMHRAVWVETARQAAMNGVNLQPRF